MSLRTREILGHAQEVVQFELLSIGDTTVTVGTLASAAAVALLTVWCSRLLRAAVARGFRARKISDEGHIGVTTRLLHYLVMLVGFAIALETLGFHLSALFAAGAVFAVGLGFAMQTIAQNFVSGVILLMERSITPGDVLMVEGELVRVETMGIRSTVCRTRDEEEVIVPNSVLVQNTVTNLTLSDTLFRVRAPVGVSYDSDMAKVRQVLEATAASIPEQDHSRPPLVLLLGFGDNSVDWEVSVWGSDPWNVKVTRSQVNEAIWNALKEAGITIAYPQRDLHLDPEVVGLLRELVQRER